MRPFGSRLVFIWASICAIPIHALVAHKLTLQDRMVSRADAIKADCLDTHLSMTSFIAP